MNSDSEKDMVDDWLTDKQDFLDTSDEELNDDLLRSDEENETMRCHHESIAKPKPQAIAKPYLVCRTSHPTTCVKEEHSEVKVDPGEVLDIEINAPSGDEFQSGAEFREGVSPYIHSSCRGQPDPEETLTGPCRSPEPRFPGQHMFDQQHSASVLDVNPLAGPIPMGSLQPSGSESDPWRPSPILQGPMHPSKSWSPQSRHDPLQKHSSSGSGPLFTAPSGLQAQRPAVLVKAVARMGSSAKPMAVARGMPIATRYPASAKSTNSAKTPPAPGMVRRNVGQKVKEEPQTPPVPQKLPTKPLNTKNNEELGSEDELYKQRLNEQIQLRKEIFRQKEQRRWLRAVNKKQRLPEHLQTDSQRRWKNKQHQQQRPAPHVQQTHQRSCSRKVTHQPFFHYPPRCSVHQLVPPHPHQCHVLVPTPQPPWQQAPAARGNSSGCAVGLQYNHPHQWGTNCVVFPDLRNLHYTAWPSQPQEVWNRAKRIEENDSDIPVPAKNKVVRHFNTSIRQETTSSDLTLQMSEESRAVIETEPRVVTFTSFDLSSSSFLQHGPKLICPNQRRVSTSHQSQQVVVQGRGGVGKGQMGSAHSVPGKQTSSREGRGGGRMGEAADLVSVEGLSSSTAGVHLKNLLMSVRPVQVTVRENECCAFM